MHLLLLAYGIVISIDTAFDILISILRGDHSDKFVSIVAFYDAYAVFVKICFSIFKAKLRNIDTFRHFPVPGKIRIGTVTPVNLPAVIRSRFSLHERNMQG